MCAVRRLTGRHGRIQRLQAILLVVEHGVAAGCSRGSREVQQRESGGGTEGVGSGRGRAVSAGSIDRSS